MTARACLPVVTDADPVLIGLTGPAGSGKDTVAEYLCDRHAFTASAFAAPLRDMIEQLLTSVGIDYAYIHERSLKEQPIPGLGVSYRHMAQTLGTEWGRALDPDFWLKVTAMGLGLQAEARAPVHDRIVLTDVRFPNEADWVRAQGGVIVRIVRDTAPVREHVSEAWFAAINADHVLDNTGTLGSLHRNVDDLIDTLGLTAAQQPLKECPL